MKVVIEQNKVYLYPQGEITGEQFRIFEEEMLDFPGHSDITVNMHDINYINSESLSAFSRFFISMKSRGVRVSVCELNKNLRTIFNITCLDCIVKIENQNSEKLSE